MKITLTEEDKPHILDLTLRKGNPLYTGCEIKEIPKERRGHGQQDFELVGNQNGLGSTIFRNGINLLKTMPSDYIIVTGVVPNWARSHLHMLAQEAVSVVFTFDGKNTMMLPKAPPATRANLLAF